LAAGIKQLNKAQAQGITKHAQNFITLFSPQSLLQELVHGCWNQEMVQLNQALVQASPQLYGHKKLRHMQVTSIQQIIEYHSDQVHFVKYLCGV